MAFMEKRIICPFCFENFSDARIEYRCINPLCTARAQDTVYAKARGLSASPLLGHVFKPRGGSRSLNPFQKNLTARCDACSKESPKRLCPNCHFELSHDAGLIDDHIIAIIGGKSTGKGHYIATLIHRLEQEVGANFGFSLRMVGDETRKQFEEIYRTPLFRRKMVIQHTPSGAVDSSVKQPMLFRLTFSQGRKVRAVNLTFFDSAGEDMQALDTMSTEARYICHASGIIFLLDPLQIETVRQKVAADILPPRDESADPIYIVERLRELFERQQRLAPTDKVRTPVAFVLSKIDTLLQILDASTALKGTGEHFGSFDAADSQSVHTEIWNYLYSWMGAGITDRIEANFAQYRYFGVSSLGRIPDKTGKIEVVSPIRVEDPFLWILNQLGMIEKRKTR